MLTTMSRRALDAEIDRLYQLPLDEFTAARNALAKTAGGDAADVRALVKPPIAAWAVNQLHWKDRDVWDALIAAAENVRRAHKAVLAGRAGDVRAANKVHEDAIETAVKATLALLSKAGHPVTDATRQTIGTTIRALPGTEPPGRLTAAVQPAGFEMLAGLSIAGAPARPAKQPPAHVEPSAKPAVSRSKADSQALILARQAVAAAAQAIRDAEHAIKREEFEIARATREEERAAKGVEGAREALKRAKDDLERAEEAASTATAQREAAGKREREAQKALADARRRSDAAASQLKRIEKS